jgi:hypothetical protein
LAVARLADLAEVCSVNSFAKHVAGRCRIVGAGAMEGLLLASYLRPALAGAVEGSMHHTGRSSENGAGTGMPCSR